MSDLTTNKVLYLDLELTCGNKYPHEIIQIGIVEVNTDELIITREAMYYVKPYKEFHCDWFCRELTGITDDIINKQGRPFHEVHGSLKRFGIANKLTYSWGNDKDSINRAYTNCPKIIDNPYTFSNLAWLFKNLTRSKQSPSLKSAIEFLGLEFEGRQHNALYDAKNTARVHMELIRRYREYENRLVK